MSNIKIDMPKTAKNTANYPANSDQVKSSTVTESLLSSLKNLDVDLSISLLVSANYRGNFTLKQF